VSSDEKAFSATRPFSPTRLGSGGIPGVLVEGLTRETIRDPQVAQQLRDLWIDVGLIVFRGLSGTEAHLELSRVFGVLTSHPSGVAHNAVHPELSDIFYRPEDANIYEIDGQSIGGYLPWHSDLTYFAEINRGGILRAIEPSKEGGRTGFLDQIAAYERLPQPLRERIENLYVVYWGDFRQEHARFSRVTRVINEGSSLQKIIAKRDQFPRVAHPMVYVQAETGRKVLNVSPWFAMGIEGMQNAEGDSLLAEVVSYCTDERHAYFHQWQPEDMVLWDNWRMLHCATGVPPNARRIMQRTTILGDYALGRVVGEWADADTLERVDV
jgi:taurine dioxygenase